MVDILQPACIFMQLGSFCFFLSGMFGDLLLIRLCLVGAYVWLLIAAAVGYPIWPDTLNAGWISLDGIVWAVLNLLVHGLALGQMLWDERPIRCRGDTEERVWRFFLRRSGMGRLEFHESWKRARTAQFTKGQLCMGPEQASRTLMVMVEGLAHYRIEDPSGKLLEGPIPLISGSSFDIGLLNILGVYIGFEKAAHEQIFVTAATDCLVVFWDLEALNVLATRCSPAVSAYWRNYALCAVGLEWYTCMQRNLHPGATPVNARGRREPAGIMDGTAPSSDFTDALEPWECPPRTLRGVLAWLPTTLSPLLPPGMRHHAMPRAGALARNRFIALGAAGRSADSVVRSERRSSRELSRKILRLLQKEAGQPTTPSEEGRVAGGTPADSQAGVQAAPPSSQNDGLV